MKESRSVSSKFPFFWCQDLGLGWHQTPCFEAVSEIVEVIHRKVLELVELVIFSDV